MTGVYIAMKPVISFDLDGTVGKSDFNDLVWLEVVPSLCSQKHGITLKEVKEQAT